jgi:hypothetical protein
LNQGMTGLLMTLCQWRREWTFHTTVTLSGGSIARWKAQYHWNTQRNEDGGQE